MAKGKSRATHHINMPPHTKQDLLKLFETSTEHIFLTGNAGTGKTTLVNNFRSTTEKNIAVVAPTGVAAVNIKGETIHSFFGFPPNITLDRARLSASRTKKAKIYQSLDILVIDEISMVRADLLDCIDVFLQQVRKRKSPFGGVKLIMVGDLYQLPPVVTSLERVALHNIYDSPFFFSSHVFEKITNGLFKQLIVAELTEIYRQKDPKFIAILNKIRHNLIEETDLEILNKYSLDSESLDDYVLLTTINDTADRVNEARLSQIDGPLHVFHALVTGDFSEKQAPAGQTISLKTGAKVMLLNNDSSNRWINGTTGTLFRVSKDEVFVKLENGEVEKIEPITWNAYKTIFNEEKNKIESFEVGSFKQIPLRLAWAITIHKSQGKTFEKVAVDFGQGTFAHGQAYVALSRATSLEGLRLVKPLAKYHIIVDRRVQEFLAKIKDLSV